MARDLNKVQMTGRLGADPEMRYTAQGHAVTTFRAASNRSWRTAEGEAHEDTEWFRVVAWNKLAEICNQWLSKGSRVYVEGRMQTRQWQDQEGQTRYQTEVIAIDIIILDSRRDGTPAPQDDAPVAIDATPTSRTPRSPAATTRTSAAPVAAPARAAKVARLPRGKDAFEEEDLPF
jgi:single-strand DNA-binding protein